MKKSWIQYLVIGTGVLALLFLAWYSLPSTERELSLEELRTMLREGKTPQERAAGAAGLGDRRDAESTPMLLDAMQDQSALVRGRAGVAVKKILGADFFFRAEDPPEKRHEVIQRYRDLWMAWQIKHGKNGSALGNSSQQSNTEQNERVVAQ